MIDVLHPAGKRFARDKGTRIMASIGAILATVFILSALQLASSAGRISTAETDLIVFNIAATSSERLSHLPAEKLEILRDDARRATTMDDTDQRLAAAAVSKIEAILSEKSKE